jgi:hypothetical protein
LRPIPAQKKASNHGQHKGKDIFGEEKSWPALLVAVPAISPWKNSMRDNSYEVFKAHIIKISSTTTCDYYTLFEEHTCSSSGAAYW